ncbi:tripartite motif-containing protein 43-like [Sminthopsis crassicaudata]|uniref:tripartite motif-containing protein 43-like n=1 Tax=Sminthopsis crassicaudata TaxID=9301 RepID=UPI003D6808EB
MMKGLPNVLTCSICRVCLSDPVAADCGHSICRSCLSTSGQASVPVSCWRCREISQSRTVRRKRKHTFRHKKPSVPQKQQRQRPAESTKCDRHQEDKKFFCVDDQTLLCVPCSQSQEHENHTFQPIEDAAKLYREKLLDNLKLVNVNLNDVQKLMLEEKKIPRTWAVVWTEEGEMPRNTFEKKFQKIRDFLSDEEEEVHSLVELNEEENEMFENLKKQETQQEIQNRKQKWISSVRMSKHRNDLREMAMALEEKSRMPDMNLLEDIEDTLNKSELLLLQKPEPFTPKLSSSYCMDLREFLKKFQESRWLQCHYPYELPDDDRKRTFTFSDIASGQMYAVYTSGSLHYLNRRNLSITQLKTNDTSEKDQDYSIFTCYCLPIERENSVNDFSSQPSIEWH